jgi:hypothetical protein
MEHLVELPERQTEKVEEKKVEEKKVVINEEKNQVIGPPAGQSEKIDLSAKYRFLVLDTLTESVVGLYKSNNVAVNVITKLVKKDLETLVQEHRIRILNGESIEENRISLSVIKQALYQIKTIDHSKMTHIIIGDRNVNRYKILMCHDDERDITEEDLISY